MPGELGEVSIHNYETTPLLQERPKNLPIVQADDPGSQWVSMMSNWAMAIMVMSIPKSKRYGLQWLESTNHLQAWTSKLRSSAGSNGHRAYGYHQIEWDRKTPALSMGAIAWLGVGAIVECRPTQLFMMSSGQSTSGIQQKVAILSLQESRPHPDMMVSAGCRVWYAHIMCTIYT
jgi:hypothetical protein